MDPAGHVISMQRMDNCAPTAYPKFAQAKAFTCVSLGVSTRVFRDKYTAAKDPAKFCQMLSMGDLTGGQMAPFPGGVVIKGAEDGDIVGAVGVSGASADEDEYCALVGVQEAGLEGVVTEPIHHALKN
ncbi:hypothetical protein VYU27_001050 [Nannochloropsis oceanica]